jgi:hypothetical protein
LRIEPIERAGELRLTAGEHRLAVLVRRVKVALLNLNPCADLSIAPVAIAVACSTRRRAAPESGVGARLGPSISSRASRIAALSISPRSCRGRASDAPRD